MTTTYTVIYLADGIRKVSPVQLSEGYSDFTSIPKILAVKEFSSNSPEDVAKIRILAATLVTDEMNYKQTHMSLIDGSTAMVLNNDGDFITLTNEDGHEWTDPCHYWVDLTTTPACVPDCEGEGTCSECRGAGGYYVASRRAEDPDPWITCRCT